MSTLLQQLSSRFSTAVLFLLFITAFQVSNPCQSQEDNSTSMILPVFDSTLFLHNWERSEWLYEYEEVSWYGSENHPTEPGNTFTRFGQINYCFKDQAGLWHIIKGISNKGLFSIVQHLGPDTNSQLTDSDSLMFQSYSQALNQSHIKLGPTLDSIGIYFDQYIWQMPDSSIQVYVIPAFQPSGQAVYGLEWGFRYTADGRHLLSSSQYIPGYKVIWVGQPREIRLRYNDSSNPTLGSLCFANSYKDFFTRIIIELDSFSLALSKANNGNYQWRRLFKSNSE